jgi:hypothetical protein
MRYFFIFLKATTTRFVSGSVAAGSFQNAKYPSVGAESIFPFDFSGEPSFAQVFRHALLASATDVVDDGFRVTSRSNFGVHAGTLQHTQQAPF